MSTLPTSTEPGSADPAAAAEEAIRAETDRAERAAAPAIALPTRDDPVVRLGSRIIGGPLGPRVRVGAARFWTPMAVLMLLATCSILVGLAAKQHCRVEGWQTPDQFFHVCYSDVPLLFGDRGLADGAVPYFANVPDDKIVEYPVLTGAVMWVTALLTPGQGYTHDRALTYFDINLVGTGLCLLVTVAATALVARRRPWDAAIVALSPGIILTATINWDMWVVALTSVAMLMWARGRPGWTGIVLGLAIATKFYPLFLFGPLLLLCLRAGKLRAFATTLACAVVAWLVVNLPVMIGSFHGWARFYTFSSDRGAGFSSPWFVYELAGGRLSNDVLMLLFVLTFALCCLGVAVLALSAPRRPRFAQLVFLVVAGFLLTNKVYSPQYVVWLVPLAALARPRWRDILIWQAGEVVHFVGVWLFIAHYTPTVANRSLPAWAYSVTVIAHMLGTAWLAAVVVRDVLRPDHDPVRRDGSDDPSGGVLDGAPDLSSGLRPQRPTRRRVPVGAAGAAD